MAARPHLPLPSNFRSDADVIAQHHRFIRTLEDDAKVPEHELRLARRYYDRLFREYAICDLSRAEERAREERAAIAEAAAAANDAKDGDADAGKAALARLTALRRGAPPQIGLRWRTRAEVVSGRGHLSCGSRSCSQRAALSTFELPFRWREIGEAEERAALVKVRLCPRCAALLPVRAAGRGGGSTGGGGSVAAARGRRRRDGTAEEGERGREREHGTKRERRAARSRSRSPPPQPQPPPLAASADPAAATAAAGAAAAERGGRGERRQQDEEVEDDEEEEEDGDARLDRLVQDMINAFEAGG